MKTLQFEDPLNTVKDVVDQNITIFEYDFHYEASKSFYRQQSILEWDHVANNMVAVRGCGVDYCANTNDTYQYMIKHHVFGNRTHAFIKGYLYRTDLGVMPEKKNWWRSEKVLTDDSPYTGLITSRKWILNEVNFFKLY